jgi:DnaJ-class molecular chaperone
MSMFFGGGAKRAPSGPRKSEDLEVPLKVSLEDLYIGKEMKIAVTTTSYEKSSDGSVMDRAGNRYNKKLDRVLLDVTIDKGMNNGQRITFAGKGNTVPGEFCVVCVMYHKRALRVIILTRVSNLLPCHRFFARRYCAGCPTKRPRRISASGFRPHHKKRNHPL